MSIIASVNNSQYVLSKGAPEVLCKFMKEKPTNYDEMYLKYVKDGARVLALAYKPLNRKMNNEAINQYTREEAECDLTFCGFIIAECPLKEDTKDIIKELVFSSHECKMITGDNALTAAFVGQKLEMGTGKSLFAHHTPAEGQIVWHDIDD